MRTLESILSKSSLTPYNIIYNAIKTFFKNPKKTIELFDSALEEVSWKNVQNSAKRGANILCLIKHKYDFPFVELLKPKGSVMTDIYRLNLDVYKKWYWINRVTNIHPLDSNKYYKISETLMNNLLNYFGIGDADKYNKAYYNKILNENS